MSAKRRRRLPPPDETLAEQDYDRGYDVGYAATSEDEFDEDESEAWQQGFANGWDQCVADTNPWLVRPR